MRKEIENERMCGCGRRTLISHTRYGTVQTRKVTFRLSYEILVPLTGLGSVDDGSSVIILTLKTCSVRTNGRAWYLMRGAGAAGPTGLLPAPCEARAVSSVVSHELEEAEGQRVSNGLEHGAPQPHGLRLARHEGLQVGEA